MINPQMMGQMGMPQVPSVKELWKNEKSKYRHWIILLGVGLVAIFAILLAASVMNWADVGSFNATVENNKWDVSGSGVKFELAKILGGRVTADMFAKGYNLSDLENDVNHYYTTNYIIFPSIKLGLLAIGIVLYGDSLIKSYKAKSFSKLSTWPTMIVGIAAIMAFFSFFSFGSSMSFQDQFKFAGGIFTFVANLLFILIYFVASAPVSRLRRIFMVSERVEQLKAMQQSPQFQQMQQQMMQGQGSMGAFGPMGAMMGQQPQAQPQQPQGQTVNAVQPEVDPERKKLEGMKKDELIEVAKELSISGYSTMDKKELIDAILRVTENN